jgi:hypothetical protein
LACLSVFQPIGVVICSAIAFGFIPVYACSPNFSEPDALQSCKLPNAGANCCSRGDNMGWRYLLFTIGAITLLVFVLRFFVFDFHETPKFLVYRGKDAKAIDTLQHMAKVNKKQCGLTLELFESLQSDDSSVGSGNSSTPVLGAGSKQLNMPRSQKLKLEMSRYKMLFSSAKMTRLTILVWLTYIMDYWGFTVAGKSILQWAITILISCQVSTCQRFSQRRTVPKTSASHLPTLLTSTLTHPAL